MKRTLCCHLQPSGDAATHRTTALATPPKKVVDDFIGRLCWHFFRRYRWMTAARYAAECLPLKAKYLFCFNLFAVWWVDMWQFRAFEKSTYFLYSWQFSIFFFFFCTPSSGIWFFLMWKKKTKKKHPSGARSRLKLTLYVICKANCNHREIVFVATANPP